MDAEMLAELIVGGLATILYIRMLYLCKVHWGWIVSLLLGFFILAGAGFLGGATLLLIGAALVLRKIQKPWWHACLRSISASASMVVHVEMGE